MEKKTTLEAFLSDFTPTQPAMHKGVKSGGPVTIWLPAELKPRYDRLQALSGRKFGKKVREMVAAMIEIVEGKTA